MNLDRLRQSDGWVVRNLREYGNSVVPTIAIKYLGGVENAERLLSMITGKDIHIRYFDCSNADRKETYIAEGGR